MDKSIREHLEKLVTIVPVDSSLAQNLNGESRWRVVVRFPRGGDSFESKTIHDQKVNAVRARNKVVASIERMIAGSQHASVEDDSGDD